MEHVEGQLNTYEFISLQHKLWFSPKNKRYLSTQTSLFRVKHLSLIWHPTNVCMEGHLSILVLRGGLYVPYVVTSPHNA